jgi:UDP-N-acetylmuramoyl-L-alanyl-D-glutamate--2,6-diaminopimelate ligase
VPGLHWAVLNADDGLGRELLDSDRIAARRLAYTLEGRAGLPPADAHLLATDVRLHPDGLRMTLDGSFGRAVLNAGLLGRFNAANLLGVLGVLLGLDLPLEEAVTRLARVRHAPGRLERFGQGGAQPLVVVDYAHTPAALAAALTALRAHCSGRLWCVFGCGGDRDRGKRPLMGAVAERLADRVILTDDNPRTEDPAGIIADILAGATDRKAFRVIRDRRAAIQAAVDEAGARDVVLVAGKGHEDYQIVGERRLPFSDREVVGALLATEAGP